MIKSEKDKNGIAVKIEGNTLDIMREIKAILDSFAQEDKMEVLDTVFLDLADYYTKEEMIKYIDRAFMVKDKTITVEDLIDKLRDLMKILNNKD